jgi:ribosomal protein L39E
MSSHTIENVLDLKRLIALLSNRELPMTVNIKKGKDRTVAQNKLQRMWMLEAEAQGDQTAEEYRAYCKLHIGVPILRSQDDDFKAAYDAVIRPLTYEQKLKAMMIPLDFSVSRLMTTKQFSEYSKKIYEHFTSKGIKLTDPDDEN